MYVLLYLWNMICELKFCLGQPHDMIRTAILLLNNIFVIDNADYY